MSPIALSISSSESNFSCSLLSLFSSISSIGLSGYLIKSLRVSAVASPDSAGMMKTIMVTHVSGMHQITSMTSKKFRMEWLDAHAL